LKRSEALYGGAAMPLHVAYARRRHGELLGGATGNDMISEADHILERTGIRQPDRWLELQAPGFSVAAS
jgi:hypothetical protein